MGKNMLFRVILAWICFLYSCFSLQSPPKLSLVKVDHLLLHFFDARGNFAPRIRCWATKQTKTALFSKPSLWVSMLVFRERKIPNLHCLGVLAISLSGGVVTKSWISRLGYPASEGYQHIGSVFVVLTLDLFKMLGTSEKENMFPNGGFSSRFTWYKVENHFKQIWHVYMLRGFPKKWCWGSLRQIYSIYIYRIHGIGTFTFPQ